MDPENGPLEKCFPLPTSGFQGPWDRFPGYSLRGCVRSLGPLAAALRFFRSL